ncbi:putative ubiquitin-conjugating enzyme protein 17 [Trichinella pseudospiralis]|uniref:Putative ubiquitin-conjugating enzyme protein 17 n=1 Tax=Trichinella pseudospiralis TaxID=6337 RepID=A0A0V1DYL4_TRIPS|nr:putative ubiquitin-conjugating enzyme protein 17 [Trichinella pseudospiralis]KRZ22773.1 putative ubiquitin-conjugating enzyme protein 17 [Trichinella pseudospiralis]KRZ28636.1 putative ubiquitin-conjugating enzyme protein 17 [Trichinella pseudospiralis]
MGTSVSLASSPEPDDLSPVERAREILKQTPLRFASMIRLSRIINDSSPADRLQLVHSGILKRIVELINGYYNCWNKLKVVDGMEKLSNSTCSSVNSHRRHQNNSFVSQITVGRRKTHTTAAANRGIGYGCGSTRCQWDIERYIEETIVREEQLAWLMHALVAFLHCSSPDFTDPTAAFEEIEKGQRPHVNADVVQLLRQSSIVTMARYNLKNESIFDISERLDFYQALLETIAAMAIYPQLAPVVLTQNSPSEESLTRQLLPRFRNLIVSYLAFIRLKLRTPDLRLSEFLERVDVCHKLLIICQERHSAKLEIDASSPTMLDTIPQTPSDSEQSSLSSSCADDINQTISIINIAPQPSLYTRWMKAKQIRSWRIIDENGKLLVPYTYGKEAKSLNPLSLSFKASSLFFITFHIATSSLFLVSSSALDRGKRIAREIASLENNIPLNESNSIFVCIDESRCDLMKVLITGPDQTPYQNGCFEFDVFFPANYPFVPPKMTFLTTNSGEVRFNPNLYQDGKVCLSILNTWEGRPEEKWNPYCSLLQLLVSVQALIFVKEPYFNEPGFEKYICTDKGQHLSKSYNQQLNHATLQLAIVEQLRKPPECFKDIILRHFWFKKDSVRQQAQQCLNDAMQNCARGSRNEDRKLLYSSETETLSLKTVATTVEALNFHLNRLEKTRGLCEEDE